MDNVQVFQKVGDEIRKVYDTGDVVTSVRDAGFPGQIVAFSGAFGGKDNRHPIPEGSEIPDTDWVLCDGIETDGIPVPDLRDKFIIGAGPSHAAGTTGGSFTTDGHTLTEAELATHHHTYSILSANNVTQGTMSFIRPATTNANASYLTDTTGNSSPHTHTFKPPYYALAFIKQIHKKVASIVMPSVNFEREALFTSAKTSITIPAGTYTRVGEKVLVNSKPVTLSLDNNNGGGGSVYPVSDIETYATGNPVLPSVPDYGDTESTSVSERKGKDMYLYACQPPFGYEPVYVLSMNSTVPNGYTAENSRKIGGFHCLCADVGTIADHGLSGYVAGDILPLSVWDLRHRARSENEGMVWISRTNLWWDIYLNSLSSASNLLSVFNGVICHSMTGEDFGYKQTNRLKRLPKRDDFVIAATGSNTGTNIQGSVNPNTTGGHVDTAGRRMISIYGLEDCCGVLWQWTNDLFEGGAYGSVVADQEWLNGYDWDMGINSVGDSGAVLGFLRRPMVGGSWGRGSFCGRRAVICRNASASVHPNVGGRGVSEPRIWGA